MGTRQESPHGEQQGGAVSRSGKLGVALAVGGIAVGLAACGGPKQAIGPGVYRHQPYTTPTSTPSTRPTSLPTEPTTAPTSTTEPGYLHPPSGEPWLVRGTANWVAAQYVSTANAISWTWSSPAEYLAEAKGYMTPGFYRLEDGVESRALANGGAPGDAAYWRELVARHDGTYVQVDFAEVATEAGVTPTTEVIRVAYWTGQVVGGVEDPVDTSAAPLITDCVMDKIAGRWYVASIQSPEAG